MISVQLTPRERFSYLISDTLSKVLVFNILAGTYLIYFSFMSAGINEASRLKGGIILIATALIGLAISYRKVKRLQRILSDASVTTALKGDLTPTAFTVSFTQAHEVAYGYEVDDHWHPVYMITFWHSSCKPEEPVVYANADHGESVLMRRLPDSVVDKINEQNEAFGELSTA